MVIEDLANSNVKFNKNLAENRPPLVAFKYRWMDRESKALDYTNYFAVTPLTCDIRSYLLASTFRSFGTLSILDRIIEDWCPSGLPDTAVPARTLKKQSRFSFSRLLLTFNPCFQPFHAINVRQTRLSLQKTELKNRRRTK